MTFEQELERVREVLWTCNNNAQFENAKNWALDWTKRMERVHPEKVKNSNELYQQLLNSPICECQIGKVVKSHKTECPYMNEYFGE